MQNGTSKRRNNKNLLNYKILKVYPGIMNIYRIRRKTKTDIIEAKMEEKKNVNNNENSYK